MWATRAAALMALVTLVAQGVMGEATGNSLAKRCRACPLIVPECHACPDGQKCTITPQECLKCAVAECVADSDTSGIPLVTTGFSSFPLGPLPPGVTPTTVSHNEQTSAEAGAPSDTGTSKITANVPIPVTPAKSQSAAIASKSASQGSSSSASGSASQVATSTSSSSGLAAKHAAVPWAVEVGVAALGLLAL